MKNYSSKLQTIRIRKPGKREIELKVGKGEEKELRVVVDGRGGGKFEVEIRVVHVGKGGRARVELRGVVSEGARLKAEGLIKISKGAQEVESFLDMRGLMLDGESLIELDPQLEIEVNEVRASHAASVSAVSEESLEFLESMGIEKKRGSEMMVEGFLDNLIIQNRY